MASKEIDIRKTGYQDYRQLQNANDLAGVSQEALDFIENLNIGPVASVYDPRSEFPIELKSKEGNFGESYWDPNNTTLEGISRLQDVRAENQWALAKLGAGISKGITLAGTTFIDGTLGLIYGLGSAAHEWTTKTKESGASWDNFTSGISKLWDNDVSNSLHDMNQKLEEWLPNYKTEVEENNPWYRNLGTMNFWADSFIKNLGFTVGAYYSGAAWTKALRGLGMLKGPLTTEVLGSTLSALNEGRIEATNNVSDWKELQITQLQNQYQRALQGLNPDDPLYAVNAGLLKQNYDKQLQEIDDRASSMGSWIMLANTILLSYNNFKTYGKLYSMGYRNAEKNMASTAAREMGKRVSITDEGKYLWNAYTRGEGLKGGLKTGLREGLEEMNQAFISETFGNKYSPDSPDSYYEALLDSDADVQVSDFLSSAAKGFVDTYGSGQRWEEFVVGALTGLLGMPTFGRMNNSGTETYLGKNKVIGLSGGLFGEIAGNNARNAQGQAAVDIMNKYADKVKEQKDYFVQGQSFTNAMDRWSAEANAFEYKNAEDNDDFAAISAFARVGKLSDLKDMVNQNFGNFSDEDLDRIAKYASKQQDDPTVPRYDGWRSADGKYLSESEEGRAQMRAKLSEKKDKILRNIEQYENSVELVRGLVHDSPQVTEDQINELAWLNWKLGRFTDRLDELKKDNDNSINAYLSALTTYKDALQEEIQSQLDEAGGDIEHLDPKAYAETSNMIKSINGMIDFINTLKTSKNPLEISAYLETNKEFFDAYFSKDAIDLFGLLANGMLSYGQMQTLYTNLKDMAKMGDAYKQFNERFKEFTKHPENILTVRQKLEKKARKTKDNVQAERVAQQLINDFEGTIDNLGADVVKDILDKAENPSEAVISQGSAVANFLEMREVKDRISTKVDKSGADIQTKADAKALVKGAPNLQELTDLSSATYSDPSALYSDNDPSLVNKSNAEQESILTERLDKAKTLLQSIIEEVNAENADTDNITPTVSSEEINAVEETGNDPTAKTEPVGEVGGVAANVDAKDVAYLDSLIGTADEENIKNLLAALKNATKGTPQEIIETLKTTKAWDNLAKAVGDDTVEKAVLQFLDDADKTTNNPLLNSVAGNIDSDISEENNNSLIGKSVGGVKLYWTSGQNSLPIHIAKDSKEPLTKYYELVNTPGYGGYSDAQVKYIQAVGKYLESHGTWQRIDNGLVKADTDIYFATDPALNKDANATVILLVDKDGNVLGNLFTDVDNDGKELDATFTTYGYLNDFRKQFIEQYTSEDRGDEKWVMPNVTSHIDKWMIGHVLYDARENMHTAVEIFSTQDSEGNLIQQTPLFAIAAVDRGGTIRIVRDSNKRQNSTIDLDIVPPLVKRNGQPYILLTTGSTNGRKFICVPVQMKQFDASVQGQFRDFVKSKLIKLYELTKKDKTSTLMSRKDAIQTLLGAKFSVRVFNDNSVSVMYRDTNGTQHVLPVKESAMSAEDAANAALEELNNAGIPIQMSLKYINKQYEEVNYNDLISPYVLADILPQQQHTTGNWFTIGPIKDGKEIAAKSPKSTGKKAPAPRETSTSAAVKKFVYNGNEVEVDTDAWDKVIYIKDDKVMAASAYQKNGKCNEAACKALANCYGQHLNLDMSKPYKTKWGMYDPVNNAFVIESPLDNIGSPLNDVENLINSLEGKTAEPETETPKTATDEAKNRGFLISELQKSCWNILPESVKEKIAKECSKSNWEEFLTYYDSKKKQMTFYTTEDAMLKALQNIINTPFRLDDGNTYKKWDEKTELAWFNKVLPNLATEDKLRIIRGAEKISTMSNAQGAWGQFKKGVILIAEGAARGTLYHEAFHAVTHTLLSPSELEMLYKEGSIQYPKLLNVDVEERLAEDFRRYVQFEEIPVIGKIVKLFRTIKHIVQNIVGNENVIDNLFYRINRGKLADRLANQSEVIRNRLEDRSAEIIRLKDEKQRLESSKVDWKEIRKELTEKWRNLKVLNGEVVINNRVKFGDVDDARALIRKHGLEYVAYAEDTYPNDGTIVRNTLNYVRTTGTDMAYEAAKKQREARINRINDLLYDLEKEQRLYDNEVAASVSEENLMKQEVSYENEEPILIAGLRRTKFENLAPYQKEMIIDKGLTEEEYNSLSLAERNQMLHCM